MAKILKGMGWGENITSLLKTQKEIDIEKLHSDVQYLKAALQTYGLSIKRDPLEELQKINKWEIDCSDATLFNSNTHEYDRYSSFGVVPIYNPCFPKCYPIIENHVYELKSYISPCGTYATTSDWYATHPFYCIIKKGPSVSTMEEKYNFINGLYNPNNPNPTNWLSDNKITINYNTSSGEITDNYINGNNYKKGTKDDIDNYLNSDLAEDELLLKVNFNSVMYRYWYSSKIKTTQIEPYGNYNDMNKLGSSYLSSMKSSYGLTSYPSTNLPFLTMRALVNSTNITYVKTSNSSGYNVGVTFKGMVDNVTPFANDYKGAKRNLVYEIVRVGSGVPDHIDSFIVLPFSRFTPSYVITSGCRYWVLSFSDRTTLKLYNKNIKEPLNVVKDGISLKIDSETGETVKYGMYNDLIENSAYKNMTSATSDKKDTSPSVYTPPFEVDESYYIPTDNPTAIRII